MNERLRLRMTLEKILVCLLLSLILTGCAAHKVQTVSREITQQTWLSFLKDGKTPKAEALSRLGTPSAQFEGRRILTYRLDGKYEVVVSDYKAHSVGEILSEWKRAQYSLVLVFDADKILQRHSLVRVR